VSSIVDPRIGGVLAGYRVEALLGRGGMSVVYLAQDLRLKRRVALKLLAPELAGDADFRERFLRESELAASIDHPAIVPIYDAGEVDGQLHIAMRYVEGTDLKSMLRKETTLEPRRALTIAAQLADALDVAHEHGLVHRDVKPSNVLVAARGEREHCYLSDFGLTRSVTDVVTGPFEGTIDYVAPEQISGAATDGRTDVYALGCLIFECLTGETPFRSDSEVATLYAHLEEPPPRASERRPGMPAAVDDVLARALAKSPDERYATCTALVEAAQTALGLSGEVLLPARPRDLRIVALAAVGALAVIGATLGLLLTRHPAVTAEPGADTLVSIDPGTNAVTARTPTGRGASDIAFGDGYVWVANRDDENVWRIDPRSGGTLKIQTRGTPASVAAGRGLLYVVDGPVNVSELTFYSSSGELDGGATSFPGDLEFTPTVAVGREGAWYADAEQRMVAPALRLTPRVPIPTAARALTEAYESFDGLAVGEGAVWIAGDQFGRNVWRVDPHAGRVVAIIRLGFVPKGIAAGAGGVWVTSLLGDTVSRIDPVTNRLSRPIHVGRGADRIAVAGGSVWVTNAIDETVSRVDPATGRVVATVLVGARPVGIAAGDGKIWVIVAR